MSRDNLKRVRHILEAIENIEQFTRNVTREAFIQDGEKFSAVVYQLHIIGEAMRNIDDDFRGMYLDVPAEAIVGLRNKIVHEYFGLSRATIWDTIQEDLPKLKEQVRKAIETLEKQSS